MSGPSAWLVVVAAGRGERLGAGIPKALVEVAGHPLFTYSLEAAARSGSFAGAILVGDKPALSGACDRLSSAARALLKNIVPGGERRRDSVLAGLEAVRAATGDVPLSDPPTLVHDAARPLVTPEVFRAAAVLAASGPVTCGRAPADTIKWIEGEKVAGTLPRRSLFLAETPQGALLSLLEKAHGADLGDDASDDAMLLERIGEEVRVLALAGPNFKVTTAADLALAEKWLLSAGKPPGSG